MQPIETQVSVTLLKLYLMNYQQIVSVCSYTGIVILLVACHSSHTTVYNNVPQPIPQTKIIVVKEQPRVVEKVVIIREQQPAQQVAVVNNRETVYTNTRTSTTPATTTPPRTTTPTRPTFPNKFPTTKEREEK